MNKHLIALAAAAALLAGCGGGSDDSAGAPILPAAAAAAQLRTALAAAPKPLAAVSPTDAAEQLMNFAETSVYATYFPGPRPPTQTLEPFRYRHYANGVYLGVVVTGGTAYTLGGVYVMGGEFGTAPVYVGQLSNFITPTEPGGPGGSGNGCFDLAMMEIPGTKLLLTYQYTGLQVGNLTLETTVVGPVTFQGHQAVETTVKTTGTLTVLGNQVAQDSEAKNYAKRTGDAEVTEYGHLSSSVSSVAGITQTTTTETLYAPAFVNRWFALAVGETMTRTTTGTSKTTSQLSIPGVPPTVTTNPFTSTSNVKFVGREAVTVPAGTYASCKFETTTPGEAGVTTSWLIDGKGIPVKSTTTVDGSTFTQQAISVKVNGQTL